MLLNRLIIVAFGSTFAFAADAVSSLGGPAPGSVFDARSGTVRPMIGIPGAAYLAAASISGADSAFVAPDGTTVLVRESGQWAIHAGPDKLLLETVIADVSMAAWSPDSKSVALYSDKSSQAQIARIMGQAGDAIDLSSLPGLVKGLAFDGQSILLAVTSDAAGGIYSVSASGAMLRIASASAPAAIAVSGEDLYFADQGSRQLIQVQGYSRQSAAVPFAGIDGILAAPVGAALSADLKRLYIADGGNRIAVYDISTRSLLRTRDLDFTPTTLARIGASSALLLNDGRGGAGDPLYVLNDTDNDLLDVFFVPVQQDSSATPDAKSPNSR